MKIGDKIYCIKNCISNIQSMKIGDKIYCIKNCISNIQSMEGTVLNIKGQIYKINQITDTEIKTNCELGFTTCVFTLNNSDYMFSDYFKTINQLRKEKLTKLNQTR